MTYTYGGSGSTGLQTGLVYNNITGTDFADTLCGTSGHDFIRGLGGNDILVGGAGYDVFEGGLGADRFAFQVGLGYDTVKSFTIGQDKILLPSNITYGEISFSQQNGGLAVIYGGEVWMQLEGITAVSLSSTNFVSMPAGQSSSAQSNSAKDGGFSQNDLSTLLLDGDSSMGLPTTSSDPNYAI